MARRCPAPSSSEEDESLRPQLPSKVQTAARTALDTSPARASNKAKKAAAAAEATEVAVVAEVIGVLGIAENVGEISEVEEFFDAPTSILEESAVPDTGVPSDALFTPVNLAPTS
ncbi:hypothetical protein DTO013F2_10311 [Penicillium roqueforti]|nr:hypothetical protein DTO013F2_10311 [Penicillium roqueforti]